MKSATQKLTNREIFALQDRRDAAMCAVLTETGQAGTDEAARRIWRAARLWTCQSASEIAVALRGPLDDSSDFSREQLAAKLWGAREGVR